MSLHHLRALKVLIKPGLFKTKKDKGVLGRNAYKAKT